MAQAKPIDQKPTPKPDQKSTPNSATGHRETPAQKPVFTDYASI